VKRALNRTICKRCAILLALLAGGGTAGAWANPTIFSDPVGDAVIRKTDSGSVGPIDPVSQHLPDIVEIRLGKFAPYEAEDDRFTGSWDNSGLFMRLDLVVKGLINPPGPLGYDDQSPVYQPFRFGPNPIYGWIELDMDNNENTGGEIEDPELRYLSNAARFGGRPQLPYLANRCAIDFSAFDGYFTTPPFIERSGEEFHVALQGEEIEHVHVIVEKPGGNPAIFESGETWVVDGRLFHRCHGAEQFTYQCADRNSVYKPEVKMKYAHDVVSDRTTISLVYPLTNQGCAVMNGEYAEPMNGCDDDQNSIAEALEDCNWAAANATVFDHLDPHFVLLADWQNENYASYLDPNLWRLTALVGTAYGTQPADGSRYIWTDIWPNVRRGDFNGDCKLDSADLNLLNSYITAHDGSPYYDDDGKPYNQSLHIHYFGTCPALYDTDNDGVIHAADGLLGGDMNLSLSVDLADVPDFVQALLDPVVYVNTHGGVDPMLRGDMNCDGFLDGLDIQLFIGRLLNP